MTNHTGYRVLKAILPILLALVSIFLIASYATSPEFHAGTIASLDQKNKTVLELAAASTAASAAISLLPGDTATPIANKLAELSSYFLIVISALYLEKYLTTITGYAAFLFLIPAACLLLSVNVFARRPVISRIAWKLMVFGIAIALVIPASVKVSDLIDETYNASIQMTIDSAIQTTGQLEAEGEEDAGGLRGIINGVRDTVSGAGEQIKSVLNNFLDALAVMIVTSCLIPILVMVFFIWLVKLIIGSDLEFLRVPPPPFRGRGDAHQTRSEP